MLPLLAPHLIVVCCNGGLPIVDLHLWPHEHDSYSFQNLDLTDWVATDTSGALFVNTSLAVPPGADLRYCDVYNLTFSSPALERLYLRRNGSLACRCPRNYIGDSCQLHTSAHTGGGGSTHSFKIFALIAIIPLGFALFAALGGFLCKLCCLDCLMFRWPCANKYGRALDDEDEESVDEHTLQRCREAVKGRQRPADPAPPTEVQSFLPTVSGQLAQYPYPVRGSPPPSYKSETTSLAEDRLSINERIMGGY